MAEANRNRTYPGRSYRRYTGFEDQEQHQLPVTSDSKVKREKVKGKKSMCPFLLFTQTLIEHHNRTAAECNPHPCGFVDFGLGKAHFSGLFHVNL